MTGYNWEEDLYWSDPAVQAGFSRQDGLDKVHAKFGHFRGAKRQRETEERAREKIADLDL